MSVECFSLDQRSILVPKTGCLPSQGSQGKVREFTLPLEKSGEFSEKLGKSQGISLKSENLFFLRTANRRKSINISINS